MKKIKLSDRTKQAIKRDFSTLPVDKLNKDELSYYNKVKAGKARAASGLKIKGKYLSAWLTETLTKIADGRGVTLKDYIKDNKADVERFADKGFFVSKPITHEVLIEKLEQRRAGVEIFDGDGIVKVKSIEAIEKVQMLAQHCFATSTIVVLLFRITMYVSGNWKISCPQYESYIDLVDNDFTDYLSEFSPDIEFIQSDRKGNE